MDDEKIMCPKCKNMTVVRKETEKLADEHWEWVERLLDKMSPDLDDGETTMLIGYLCKAAFIHGYKHGRAEWRFFK